MGTRNDDHVAWRENYGDTAVFPSKAGNLSSRTHPSVVCKDIYGRVRKEEWWWKGKMHRKGGPAEIWYDIKGEQTFTAWRIKGCLMTSTAMYSKRAKIKEADMFALVLKYGEIER